MSRVSLSANGYDNSFTTTFDWEKGTGNPFGYYSYGVGCSIVEIDSLTGDFKV